MRPVTIKPGGQAGLIVGCRLESQRITDTKDRRESYGQVQSRRRHELLRQLPSYRQHSPRPADQRAVRHEDCREVIMVERTRVSLSKPVRPNGHSSVRFEVSRARCMTVWMEKTQKKVRGVVEEMNTVDKPTSGPSSSQK